MAHQRIGDIELYYEVHGAGEPVVFIHGLGSSARDWILQVEAFSADYQVVTFDLRGHGQSKAPPGLYSIPAFARDTTGLVEHLGKGPVNLVGISLGGMVGLQMALDAPAWVKRLVVVNSVPHMVVENLSQQFQVWQRLLIVRLLGMRGMGKVLAKRLFPKADQAALRALFIARWVENDRHAYLDSMKAILGWSVRDRLVEIACPVLVVAADEDYTPVKAKEDYVKRIPQAELVVIADSRHATPVDQPEAFNLVLRRFLASQV